MRVSICEEYSSLGGITYFAGFERKRNRSLRLMEDVDLAVWEKREHLRSVHERDSTMARLLLFFFVINRVGDWRGVQLQRNKIVIIICGVSKLNAD